MSELQSAESADQTLDAENPQGFNIDDGVEEKTEQEAPTGEAGAELATAPEGEQDKDSQDAVQKAINKQHAKYREEERKRIETEQQLKEAKERLEALEAQSGEVVVPPIPDPYDEDYEAKVRARDDAIMRKAQSDAAKAVKVEQTKSAEEAAQKAEQDRVDGLVTDYERRAMQSGLDLNDVRAAGKVVVDYGVSNDVALYLLEEADGPLITQYLAQNPLELDSIRHMSPIMAAMKINNEIKPKAQALKPQATQAPDPAETLDGKGVAEQLSPLLTGATFE